MFFLRSLLRNRQEWSPKRWGGSLSNESKALEGPLNIVNAEQLKKRSLIAVRGYHSADLLQSLLTNDIRILEEKESLYAFFLNSKGKVIFDAIIYNVKDTFFIECDVSGVQALQMHMKMYKMGRKVSIESIENEMKVWVVFDPSVNSSHTPLFPNKHLIPPDEGLIYAPDPRLPQLGLRILVPRGFDLLSTLKSSGLRLLQTSALSYKMLRFKLGVGEGLEEIPYSKYTAMETNADFLNGICAEKSSYIGRATSEGEEVKKRLMPLVFENEPMAESYPADTAIEDEKGRRLTPLGELRGIQGCFGLGLIALSARATKIKLGSFIGQTFTPSWWPQEPNQPKKEFGSPYSLTASSTIHL